MGKMKDYEWVDVDEETFDKFLENYPRKLVADFYMDYWSFYDFTLNKEPCVESEVAHYSIYDEYSIRKDLMEVK